MSDGDYFLLYTPCGFCLEIMSCNLLLCALCDIFALQACAGYVVVNSF